MKPPDLHDSDPMTHLTDLDASALSHLIHDRQVSCAEVMQAFLERISRLRTRFSMPL
jgi:hypothetical protein